ncbi:hypothetical protein ARMSODRAFT_379803 [Armillaria solidipes]|uniref:Uncharacterized protein n=1 Tax=Armillaria solidipes TaxID=1076256 RepID=A0A2H3BAH5_9AGAR|nr:hypothetical protein ARMSODRAFT_379803 [Armillaria solidipes]
MWIGRFKIPGSRACAIGRGSQIGRGEWAGRGVSRNCFRFFSDTAVIPFLVAISLSRLRYVGGGWGSPDDCFNLNPPPHDPLRSVPSKLEYSTLPKLAEREYHFGRFPVLMYSCGSPSSGP